jgi:hypothetical protein
MKRRALAYQSDKGQLPSMTAVPLPSFTPTALPDPKHSGLWKKAMSAARKNFKRIKNTEVPDYIIKQWAIDWYANKGGEFIEEKETAHGTKVKAMRVFARTLTSKECSKLADGDFAIVANNKRSYPVISASHGIAAISRAAATNNPKLIKKVRSFVFKKYPYLKQTSDTKSAYGNSINNLAILSNSLKLLSANYEISILGNPDGIKIIANSITKITLKNKAFYKPQAEFKVYVAKITRNIVKARVEALDHLSPTLRQHHTDMANHHLEQSHAHYTNANKHDELARVESSKGNHKAAQEHTDIANYHKEQASQHSTGFQKHLPHLKKIT